MTTKLAAAFALSAGLLAAAPPAFADEPGVSKDTIRIGMFAPLTGAVSMYGYPIADGAIAIFKQANDAGGINGRKIEVVLEDGACDPAKTRAAVKKLISQEDVFMVNGGNCSAAAFATRDTFIDEEVPYMVMAATLDKISQPTNHFIFTAQLTGTGDGATMIRFTQTIPGIRRVAVVHHTDEWANAKLDAIHAGIGNLQIVADEVLERNASDATTQVLHIKDAKPDAVIFVTYPAESAIFLRDARKYGLDGPFVGSNSAQDLLDLADRAGGLDAIKDVYVGATSKGPPDTEPMKPYVELIKKYFPNDKVQSNAFIGMGGANGIVEALRRAGPDLTREKFISALETLKDFSGAAAYCNLTFTATQHQGCASEQMWAVRDGKVIAVGEKWPGGTMR